jgi:hypothetical protein
LLTQAILFACKVFFVFCIFVFRFVAQLLFGSSFVLANKSHTSPHTRKDHIMSKRQKTDEKRILALFDVDGTLTVPRKVSYRESHRHPTTVNLRFAKKHKSNQTVGFARASCPPPIAHTLLVTSSVSFQQQADEVMHTFMKDLREVRVPPSPPSPPHPLSCNRHRCLFVFRMVSSPPPPICTRPLDASQPSSWPPTLTLSSSSPRPSIHPRVQNPKVTVGIVGGSDLVKIKEQLGENGGHSWGRSMRAPCPVLRVFWFFVLSSDATPPGEPSRIEQGDTRAVVDAMMTPPSNQQCFSPVASLAQHANSSSSTSSSSASTSTSSSSSSPARAPAPAARNTADKDYEYLFSENGLMAFKQGALLKARGLYKLHPAHP